MPEMGMDHFNVETYLGSDQENARAFMARGITQRRMTNRRDVWWVGKGRCDSIGGRATVPIVSQQIDPMRCIAAIAKDVANEPDHAALSSGQRLIIGVVIVRGIREGHPEA